jgi:hypothetical protein
MLNDEPSPKGGRLNTADFVSLSMFVERLSERMPVRDAKAKGSKEPALPYPATCVAESR